MNYVGWAAPTKQNFPLFPVRGREGKGEGTRTQLRFRKYQQGFSLVAAIFVLVVLSLLGAFMVTIGSVQRATTTQAVQSARANQAARSGIEWGIAQAMSPTCSCVANFGFPLTGPGLNGFNVTVTCSATLHQESGSSFRVYRLTALAVSGTAGDPYYVSRGIQARATDAAGPVCP